MSDLRPNIWLLQAQNDTDGLIDALRNIDPDVRRRAAAALRVLGHAAGIPALRRALNDEIDAETRDHIQAALDSLIAEYDEAEAEQSSETRQLIAQLRSSDAAVIVKAAHALGQLKDKTAVEALVLIFHNPQLPANVRLTAADALIELQSAPAVVTLLAALKNKSWKIRRNATAVLGQLRADWAVERLAERLYDENEYVQRTARAALQRIGTPPALKALELFVRSRARKKTGALPATQPLPAPTAEASPEPPAPEPQKPAPQPAESETSASNEPNG